MFTSDVAPTLDDIDAIGVGLLDVIRLGDLRRLTEKGTWEQIEEGIVTSVVIDGEVRGPFHAPAGSDREPAGEFSD